MSKKYLLLLAFMFCSHVLLADDIRFVASVSKTQVATGEQFEVTFTLNADGGGFTPPNFAGFQVLSGPNVSNSITSINGSVSVSYSYSYVLMGIKEGEFTIGTAIIVVNGRRMVSKPIRIQVLKGRPVPQNSNVQGGPDNVANAPIGSDLSKSIFIKAIVDHTTVYDGEQINLSYRLYTRVGIDDSQPDKLPDLNGFWSEDVKKPQPQRVQWRVESYKGQKFNVVDIKQSILFPEHDGNLTIDPFAMTFVVRQPVASQDIMDQVFGGNFRQVKYKVKSDPLVIHVKPLPEAGRPAGFSGAVGEFTVASSLDKIRIKANEALNYQVKITGTGNIKLFKPLSVDFPPGFEKYDPKVTDTINEDAGGVSGSRIYTYLLIPRHEGKYTIAPAKFSYFNPAARRYVTVTTKSFDVQVEKGTAANNVTSFSGDDKQDIKMLGKDIRFIKTDDGDLSKPGGTFFGSGEYFLSLLAGPIICLIAFGYRNYVRKNNADIIKVKSRNAGKVAAGHLANAQRQLLANNNKGFYEEVFKGLYGYLSDKLNIPYANLNREMITSLLKARAVDDALIRSLVDTLDLCEMARYAPVTHISTQEVFEKAKDTINKIENNL